MECLRQTPKVLFAFGLLFAALACDATGAGTGGVTPTATASTTAFPTAAPTATPTATPTSTPTPKPSPTAVKKPFFPALTAIGGSTFVGVTGAPAGSVCSVKALLQSGREITGPALKPRTVTNASQGVSWSEQDGQLLKLPSPAPSPGTSAYWLITCANNAYEPPSATTRQTFETP